MKNLGLIVAIGKNNEIGKNNKLLWYLKEDLEFFKEKTLNKTIIMGSNTFYSLPKVLSNRHHIVLTTNNNKFPNEVEVFNNIDALLKRLDNIKEEKLIIGGASIYKQFIDLVDYMYITEIDKTFDADTYFPNFNKEDFNIEILSEHEDEGMKYKHVLYKRKER